MTRQHLNDEGFIYYNTTSSPDTFFTAHHAYPYVYQYMNMALASLKPFASLNEAKVAAALEGLHWPNGEVLFPDQTSLDKGVAKIMEYPLVPYERLNFSGYNRPLELITDKNMITEYKYGKLNQ